MVLVGAGVGVLALIALAVGAVTDDADTVPDGIEQVRAVTVSGTALPAYTGEGAADPAVNQAVPVVSGASFGGEPVTIGEPGEPQLVFFLAHWCPHCRNEVPVITEWLEDKGLPEGVRLWAVSTTASSGRPNFPPSAWLERENWPVTTMADDSDYSTFQAFGGDGLPYFVAVGADGRVVARASGELPVDELEALVAAARNGAAGPVIGN
jgi:thiol-disulfide isomerase/thioredoxin